MFRIMFLVVYIVPAIYVFCRLRSYFSDEKLRKYFSILFVFSVFTFPFIEFLSHSSSISWITGITKIGYYSLPYLLYLFLTVLLVDIVLAINHLVKIVPISTIKSPSFRKSAFIIILTVPFLIVTAGALWYRNIQISNYQVDIPKKSSDLSHLKVAFTAVCILKGLKTRKLSMRLCRKLIP